MRRRQPGVRVPGPRKRWDGHRRHPFAFASSSGRQGHRRTCSNAHGGFSSRELYAAARPTTRDGCDSQQPACCSDGNRARYTGLSRRSLPVDVYNPPTTMSVSLGLRSELGGRSRSAARQRRHDRPGLRAPTAKATWQRRRVPALATREHRIRGECRAPPRLFRRGSAARPRTTTRQPPCCAPVGDKPPAAARHNGQCSLRMEPAANVRGGDAVLGDDATLHMASQVCEEAPPTNCSSQIVLPPPPVVGASSAAAATRRHKYARWLPARPSTGTAAPKARVQHMGYTIRDARHNFWAREA